MLEFAGLSDIVTIFVGTFGDNYLKLKELGVEHVDVRESRALAVGLGGLRYLTTCANASGFLPRPRQELLQE
jgi:hypothetical protein